MSAAPSEMPSAALGDSPVVVAIVAGHGRFADGLVSAVDQITGRGPAFVSISNAGLGPADIDNLLTAALDRTGARVIFTDLPAGSCTMAARRVQRARSDVVLVTGANVAVLMEFLFAAEGAPGTPLERLAAVAAIAETAAEKARLTLAVHGG